MLMHRPAGAPEGVELFESIFIPGAFQTIKFGYTAHISQGKFFMHSLDSLVCFHNLNKENVFK